MWRTLADWLLAVLNMTRELEENRAGLRRLEARVRDIEEALKLLAQEQRHDRELEAAEREKLLLRLAHELAKPKALPAPRAKRDA
jgi:cell division protein FtsB